MLISSPLITSQPFHPFIPKVSENLIAQISGLSLLYFSLWDGICSESKSELAVCDESTETYLLSQLDVKKGFSVKD